jgi:hypothetical protein
MGGVAYATLSALGGSQLPGYGYVRAFVGSNSGSSRYQWLPQFNGFTVKLANPLLSGDSASGGTISVPQADGSLQDYSYDAQTVATISGPANASIQIVAGMPGQPPTGILNLVGGNGQSGTTATVTLDANGNGSFLIQSLGNVQGGRLVLPITTVMNGDPSTTTVNYVALAPAQFIAQTKDYVNQMGWAILSGDSDSMTGMAADVGFSLIPVVGAWTDVRDLGKELLKLWPGSDEGPNWYTFGFSVLGIAGSFLGPEVDWLPTVLKKLASKVGGSPLFTAIWKIAKSGDITKIQNLGPFLGKVVSPGSEAFLDLVNRTLVKGDDDLELLNAMTKGLANGVDDAESILLKVANNPDLGDDVARALMERLGKLNPSQISAIQDAGKLDEVAQATKLGLGGDKLEAYSQWLIDVKADPTTPLPVFPGSRNQNKTAAAEARIDSYLVAKGEAPQPNLLSQEYIDGKGGPQPDRIIGGVGVEYKTVSNITAADVAGAISGDIMKAIKQSSSIILDVRGQANCTLLDCSEGVRRARNALQKNGITLDKIRIILSDTKDDFF